MLSAFGDRQQALLRALLRARDGLTVEELTAALSITRTAVNQHLAALERGGYLTRGELQKTGGRPGRVFQLTHKGIDLFPKQYAWFSALFLKAIKEQAGSDALVGLLRKIAGNLGVGLRARFRGERREEWLEEIVQVMNDLAYDARLAGRTETGADVIEASNCVYHNVALEHSEVCEFDIALLTELSGSTITHQECIVRGGNVCRFHLTPR